jgi:hypothetical protein
MASNATKLTMADDMNSAPQVIFQPGHGMSTTSSATRWTTAYRTIKPVGDKKKVKFNNLLLSLADKIDSTLEKKLCHFRNEPVVTQVLKLVLDQFDKFNLIDVRSQAAQEEVKQFSVILKSLDVKTDLLDETNTLSGDCHGAVDLMKNVRNPNFDWTTYYTEKCNQHVRDLGGRVEQFQESRRYHTFQGVPSTEPHRLVFNGGNNKVNKVAITEDLIEWTEYESVKEAKDRSCLRHLVNKDVKWTYDNIVSATRLMPSAGLFVPSTVKDMPIEQQSGHFVVGLRNAHLEVSNDGMTYSAYAYLKHLKLSRRIPSYVNDVPINQLFIENIDFDNLNDKRGYFIPQAGALPHGGVWLRLNKGSSAPTLLPDEERNEVIRLSKLYSLCMSKSNDPPTLSSDGPSLRMQLETAAASLPTRVDGRRTYSIEIKDKVVRLIESGLTHSAVGTKVGLTRVQVKSIYHQMKDLAASTAAKNATDAKKKQEAAMKARSQPVKKSSSRTIPSKRKTSPAKKAAPMAKRKAPSSLRNHRRRRAFSSSGSDSEFEII